MTTPPRLFYWAEVLWPSIGGIETFTQALLPRLAARGYDIHVLTGDADDSLPDREDMDGITLRRLPLRTALSRGDPGLLMENMRTVRALKQQIKPDIVHLNFSGPMAFYHLKTAQAAPARTVTTLHGPVSGLRGGAGTLMGDIFDRSDWVVAHSQSVLEDARMTAPSVADRSSLIYYGVEAVPAAAAQAAASHNAPHLVCAGRLVPEKGMDTAVAAFADILRRFPAARMTMAGDGSEREALEKQARSLGIADSIEFIGWVKPDHMPALMATATLVVMPSRWQEPFGLIAVEAALQSKPTLGTAVGGLREAIEDGVTGRLVPADDARALADAAVAMLSDPAGLIEMGRRGRERAERLFTMDAVVDALDVLYRRVAQHA
jgi:glycogen(starch) synthase